MTKIHLRRHPKISFNWINIFGAEPGENRSNFPSEPTRSLRLCQSAGWAITCRKLFLVILEDACFLLQTSRPRKQSLLLFNPELNPALYTLKKTCTCTESHIGMFVMILLALKYLKNKSQSGSKVGLIWNDLWHPNPLRVKKPQYYFYNFPIKCPTVIHIFDSIIIGVIDKNNFDIHFIGVQLSTLI